MLPERELWACAAWLIEHRRAEASEFALARVEALASAGDERGVLVWRSIGQKVAELQNDRSVLLS